MINKLILRIREFYQRNKYEIILVIGLIALLAAIIFIMNALPQSKPIGNTTVIDPVTNTVIKGEDYATVLQQEIDKNNKLIDSLAEALRVKPKQIKGIDRIVTDIDTIWRDSIIYVPQVTSVDSTIISMKDAYVDILAVGKKKGSYIKFNLTPDTMDMSYIQHTPLFKPAYTEVFIHHTNKYFTTTHASSFRIQERQVLFNITGSGGYNFIDKRFYIGIGITPEFLRIPIYKKRK